MSAPEPEPARPATPVELAQALATHPDHDGCCPKCRQAIAEAWAFSRSAAMALAQIADTMDRLQRGEIKLTDLMTGGRRWGKRKRGGGEEPVPESVPEGSVSVPVDADQGPPPRRRIFAGEIPGVELAPVHTHGQGWEHAHLEGDREHGHHGVPKAAWTPAPYPEATGDGEAEVEVPADETEG